jgi:hypothetical protein
MVMSKKSRHKRKQASPRRPWLPWLAVIGALVLVAGGLMLWNSTRNRPTVTPQVTGAPKLAVDKTVVDEGYVQFNEPVKTTFRLSNVGDQPLKITGAPVELAEGC